MRQWRRNAHLLLTNLNWWKNLSTTPTRDERNKDVKKTGAFRGKRVQLLNLALVFSQQLGSKFGSIVQNLVIKNKHSRNKNEHRQVCLCQILLRAVLKKVSQLSSLLLNLSEAPLMKKIKRAQKKSSYSYFFIIFCTCGTFSLSTVVLSNECGNKLTVSSTENFYHGWRSPSYRRAQEKSRKTKRPQQSSPLIYGISRHGNRGNE